MLSSPLGSPRLAPPPEAGLERVARSLGRVRRALARQQELHVGADGRVPRVPLDAALLRAARARRGGSARTTGGSERRASPSAESVTRTTSTRCRNSQASWSSVGRSASQGSQPGVSNTISVGTTGRQNPVEDRGAGPDGSIGRGLHARLHREQRSLVRQYTPPGPGRARENTAPPGPQEITQNTRPPQRLRARVPGEPRSRQSRPGPHRAETAC